MVDKPKQKKQVKVTLEQLLQAKVRILATKPNKPKPVQNIFLPNPHHNHPPSVLPKGASMAMDEDTSNVVSWAALASQNALLSEGLTFLGYPYLAELAQRPEYRHISETIATEMTREWIEIQSKEGDDSKADKISDIMDELDRLDAKDAFRRVAEKDGFFGRSHLYLDFGAKVDTPNPELATSIGTGDTEDEASKVKIKKDSLCSLKVIEPMWAYPTNYNAMTPLADNWYKPTSWFVQGTEVHSTRLLLFVGREVPDMLKPAYSFGGLSLSQMAKPYVDNWLRTRDSVSELVHSFVVFVLSTNLGTTLQSDNLINRLDLFNMLRDNKGVMVVDKDTEEFSNVQASLSGLHELQSAALEQICAITKIPLVKFTGISPSGLNASSEYEMRCFYDWIHAYQETFFRPNLTTVINFVQLSLFGEVDEDIIFQFKDLWSLNELEEAQVRKSDADTASVYINDGVLHPEEVRAAIASDPEQPYHDIDPEDVPEPPQEEGMMDEDGDMQDEEDFNSGISDEDFTTLVDKSSDLAEDAQWEEGKHKRGQPDNAGQFGSGGTGKSSNKKAKQTSIKSVSENPYLGKTVEQLETDLNKLSKKNNNLYGARPGKEVEFEKLKKAYEEVYRRKSDEKENANKKKQDSVLKSVSKFIKGDVEKVEGYIGTAQQIMEEGDLEEKYGITLEETTAIVAYVSNGHKELNKALRSGKLTSDTSEFSRQINSALDKLPTESGTVYRGATLSNDQIESYKPGSTIEEKGFTSTSNTKEGAKGATETQETHGKDNTYFEIQSKNARFLSGFSGYEGEEELLFKSNTKFKVISNNGKKIVMEEVD